MNPPAGEEQDASDVRRLAQGQDAALNRLMDRHAARLFNYLLRSLQDESDAADVAQETFVRVYRNRAAFDARQKFSTWLYAIATNLVRDRFRWRRRHPHVSLDAERDSTGATLAEQLPGTGSSPSQTLESTERANRVRAAIAALPEDLRLPLILAEYEEMPQAEIARILDCTVKAVETRIYRARKQLRSALAGLVE
jgi:RNA polymerase sigma-70 factor, ECF subfamily